MSGYSNHNNENQPIFQEKFASTKHGNFAENSPTINQIYDPKKNKTDYFKPRKTFESAYLAAKTLEADKLHSGKNINKKLTCNKSGISVNQLKSHAIGILVSTAIVFPIMGMVTVTDYFGRKAINEQTESVKLLKNPILEKIELSQQKKLLTALLIGTEAITFIAGIMAALQVKKLVSGKISELDSEIEPEKTRADGDSSNLGEFNLEKSFLQDIVEEALNSLKCDRVLIYSLDEDHYGIVIAESVADGYTQALGKIIADPCFKARYLDKYRDGRIQVINNVTEATMTSCHREQLQQLEIEANLVIPIINDDKLFGLLVANQCSQPRQWQKNEIEILKQFASKTSLIFSNNQLLDDVNLLQTLANKEREWTNSFTDIVQYIRQSLEQKDILKITVREVRRVMMCDRVIVYSLNEDRYGTVIAESVVPGYTRALDKVISDPCFEVRYLEKYRDGRVRAINNIYDAKIQSCYLEQLEVLDVRANLVIPIINEGELFGLLVAHQCSEARHWQDYEIRWLTQIATQVGFALDNAKTLALAKQQAALIQREREWTNYFTDAVQYIRQSLNQQDILNISVEEVRRVMMCDRIVVYSLNEDRYGTVVAESVDARYTKALNKVISDPCFETRYLEKYRNGRVRAFNNIDEAELTSCYLEQLKVLEVKANVVTPIINEGKIFGLLVAHQCSEARQWQDYEIRWLTQIATQVGFALDNARVLRELNSQNISTQLFKNFITSIRPCLGREELLKTAVEQVCMGMLLDRVIVYQFDREWNGTIVAELVVPGYPKSLNSYIEDPCFARQHEKKYFQGYVKAISNVREANLTECHLEKLESLAVKAIIIAPIMQNDQLFGLFIGHQCSQTRDWKLPEMEMFSQLTVQLGLALERVALKEELSFQQDSQENEAIKPLSKQNNTFPKKLSELQKISELLVENQNTLHKIKFKIDNKSSDKTSLVDLKEEENHDSITIANEDENYL